MTGKNDQFYSTTTIYVNTEQLSTGHSCLAQGDSSDHHQMSGQLNVELDNRANDLYQNISEPDDAVAAGNSACDSLNNSTNSTGQLQPPVPAPRVSLQRLKQRQEVPNSRVLEQKLEQIDENLNLVLKQHEEKFKLEDSLINSASQSANHHLLNSVENDLYVSNDRLQHEEEASNGDQVSHLGQFGLADKLSGKRISELNRNTYISDSDVNERFSNNYNELDEQIYSEIIFDESKRRSNTESWYDFPSPTDSIKFINLRPPPLPPPRIKPPEVTTETSDSRTEIESGLKESEVRIEINDEAQNDLSEEERRNDAATSESKVVGSLQSSLQSDLQNDLRNALRNHFKADLFKSSSSALNNSSSLNSSLNNGHFKANCNNPFLAQHSSSDLKLNELKESLNLMRKDHLSTLNSQPKKERAPKLNKDDLLLFERQLDGFSSATTTNFPTKSSLVSIRIFSFKFSFRL